MRKLLLSTFILAFAGLAQAQVGIGNVVPDSSAILDLRNTNNRALLLPSIPGTPPSSPVGLMYWDNALNKILYLESGGYNSLSPWRYKFNGAISENTYFNTSGNVGIGNAAPQSKLHITSNGGMLTLEGSSTAYLSLYPSTYNTGEKGKIGFPYNGTELYIQNLNSGSDVVVSVSNGGDFNVSGGRIQQNSNDLVPAGLISMWSGTSVPAGWVLCDGGTFTNEDGVTMTTPDLRGRFIVGYGNGDYTNPGNRSQGGSSSGSTGGQQQFVLVDNNMPDHSHTFNGTTGSGGYHNHGLGTRGFDTGGALGVDGSSDDSDIQTQYNGSHSHSFSGTTSIYGQTSPTAVDNRPPYYVLAFIMKK